MDILNVGSDEHPFPINMQFFGYARYEKVYSDSTTIPHYTLVVTLVFGQQIPLSDEQAEKFLSLLKPDERGFST